MQKLIRRIAAFILAVLTFLSFPVAAEQNQLVRDEPQTAQKAYPALWKVSDDDTTIYLFGTIHALPPGIEWFGGEVAKAFDGADELVTEIPEAVPGEMQKLVASHAVLPEGKSLRTMLSPEVKAAYEAQLGQFGLMPEAFDRFEPWYAAVGLSMMPLLRQGYAGENGVEQVLDVRAKTEGHKRLALETAAYQISLFDSLPADAQTRYFAEVVDNLPKAADQLGAMVEAWKRGDADHLATLMNADEDDPVLIDMLLIRRNKAWATWVKDRLTRPGKVFVAVGAGHLAGAGSLQEQLAAAGIVSQRVQ